MGYGREEKVGEKERAESQGWAKVRKGEDRAGENIKGGERT